MEEIQNYQEFGLTKNEGKVYSVLIEFGKLGSSRISRESGVSYSKIYNVLDSLIGKGLVKIIPEKTKKFVPTNPEFLIKLIEDKQEVLEKAKEKARQMKQYYEIKDKNPVLVGIGKKGFYKIVKELGEVENFEYSLKYSSEYRLDWVRNTILRLKKGKEIKSLTRYDKETEKDVKKYLKINKNIRKIQNNGIAMDIRDGCVMIALIKSNMTLLIKDKAFVEIMKKMFLETYKTAEKIK